VEYLDGLQLLRIRSSMYYTS